MGKETKSKKEIINLVEEVTDCWNRTAQQGEAGRKAWTEMFEKVEEILKIDFDQIQVERIVSKLIERSKEELIKIIIAQEKFSRQDREIREAIQRLHQSLAEFKQGNFRWDHYYVQNNVHIPAITISNALHDEIDIDKGIEAIASQIKRMMEQIEKEK